jgi:type II secretory pathway pseudopilin PulG
MLWVAVFALAFDLSAVSREPKLEKRSELALRYANTALDAARSAYQEGRWGQMQAALQEVASAVKLSHESLLATGKNPRKNSGPFKAAEKATREILRRLHGLRSSMSVVDHPVVDPVLAGVAEVHDQLVTGILTGK